MVALESAMASAMESSLESAMEASLESAMAASLKPEVGWPAEHWDQVSGAGVCHALAVGQPVPGIHLLLRELPSDGRLIPYLVCFPSGW